MPFIVGAPQASEFMLEEGQESRAYMGAEAESALLTLPLRRLPQVIRGSPNQFLDRAYHQAELFGPSFHSLSLEG